MKEKSKTEFEVGEILKLKVNTSKLLDCYPCGERGVPFRVEENYPEFVVGLVLPNNTNPVKFNTSRPYRITINRLYLRTGEVTLTEDEKIVKTYKNLVGKDELTFFRSQYNTGISGVLSYEDDEMKKSNEKLAKDLRIAEKLEAVREAELI